MSHKAELESVRLTGRYSSFFLKCQEEGKMKLLPKEGFAELAVQLRALRLPPDLNAVELNPSKSFRFAKKNPTFASWSQKYCGQNPVSRDTAEKREA